MVQEEIIGPPKKAMNPYMVFVQEQRQTVQQEHPEMSVREVVSHVAAMWRELPQEQKQPYMDKAAIDKARFDEERAKWMDGPPKKPMNSYLIFAQEQRQNVVNANPQMSVRDVVSHTATLWRQLNDEQKAPYVARANEDKARFEEERSQWLLQNKDVKRRPRKIKRKDKKKKRGQKNEVKKVKRVSPAYIFFSNANRRAVQAAQPGWKMGDVSKELGRLWREMSEQERSPYVALHEDDKERHRQEMAVLNGNTGMNDQDNRLYTM